MGNCQSDPSKDELPPGEDRPRQGPSSSSSSDPRTALREPPAGNRASVETKLKLDLKRVSGNENPLALPKGAVTQRDPSGRRKKVPPATARAPRSSGGNTARGSKTARGPATAHSALPAAPSAAAAAAPPPPPAPPPRQEDGKVYYYNTATSETQWEPPPKDGNRGWNWDPSKEKDGGANSWAAW